MIFSEIRKGFEDLGYKVIIELNHLNKEGDVVYMIKYVKDGNGKNNQKQITIDADLHTICDFRYYNQTGHHYPGRITSQELILLAEMLRELRVIALKRAGVSNE